MNDKLEFLKLWPLSGLEIQLNPVRTTRTIDSNTLAQVVLDSWLDDLVSSQLHKIVTHAGPMRPLAAVGTGAANVVLLPIQRYHRDGKVLWGLKQGAGQLAHSMALEAVQVSADVSSVVANALRRVSAASEDRTSQSSSQPEGLRNGLLRARDSVSRGVATANRELVLVPIEEYRREGVGAAVAVAIRALPAAVLAPIVGASEGLSYTLLGLRNYMDPDRRLDDELKAVRRSAGGELDPAGPG
uniref:Autophagy-related protein 2 n=2 Tax=Rhizochromulina marina TaxID=1034831 RepID=A0A7S2RNH4_9STRA|mmetsp:Transcript_18744/g.54596  ORF Transcript_18744/g.54596 Transcript_18744/m.54596 type:complete len:243 (+) Transcript_18744:29-757(+)